MTAIKDQILFLVDTFNGWAQQQMGGTAIAVPDLEAAWSTIKSGPGRPQVLVLLDGEEPRVNFAGGEVTGMVERGFSVIIQRGRGLSAERGASLTDGSGGGRPLYDLVDELVELVRSTMVGDEKTCYYKGFNQFGQEFGMLSDAYRIRFAAGTLRNVYQQF